MHAFNLYWYARPYAATALVATYDDDAGPQLYAVDPAGGCLVSFGVGGVDGASVCGDCPRLDRGVGVILSCVSVPPTDPNPHPHLPTPPLPQRYYGTAIGKGRQAAKTEIERLPLATLTCADAVTAVARILYSAHEGDGAKPFELELAWVCDASGRVFERVPADLVAEAEAAAKAALEESDDAMGE